MNDRIPFGSPLLLFLQQRCANFAARESRLLVRAYFSKAMRHLKQFSYIDAVARTGSIRRAAQSLAITSTALNRRIIAMEEDLGTPIFERTAKGVRLSVAGEIFIHHVRQQMSDLERVKSQIADLRGERRGRVSIACGQAVMQSFLPDIVSRYRAAHPYVDFSVNVCGRHEAAKRLKDFSADIGIVFEPELSTDISVSLKVPQTLFAMMSTEHPLACDEAITLSDCSQYPLALPSRRSGLRTLIETSAMHQSVDLWMALESDNMEFLLKGLADKRMIMFQISIASACNNMQQGIRAVSVSTRSMDKGSLVILQQKGRTLPVAASRFQAQLIEELSNKEYGCALEI